MGWGVINENSQRNSWVVSNSACSHVYGNDLTTAAKLCATGIWKDSSQGDIGGHLIIKGSHADNDVLVDIVSWGYMCADPDSQVYTR